MKRYVKYTTVAAFAFAMCIFSGCGKPMGTVSGTVTYQGKPLTAGDIVFVSNDQMHSSGSPFSEQGNYRLTSLPVGDYKVGLIPPRTYEDLKNPDTYITPPPSPIQDPKYASPETSGLTFSIKKGSNTADFAIE